MKLKCCPECGSTSFLLEQTRSNLVSIDSGDERKILHRRFEPDSEKLFCNECEKELTGEELDEKVVEVNDLRG